MKKMMAIAFAIVIGIGSTAFAQVADDVAPSDAADQLPSDLVSDSEPASDLVSDSEPIADDQGAADTAGSESAEDSVKSILDYLKCLKYTGFDFIACSK